MNGHPSRVQDESAPTMYDLGLPPRPPTSQRLWAHLLSGTRDPGIMAPELPPPNPPLAPADKTSTSMRILLHDTQTNFEKFSSRVDTLILNVDETKREIREVNNQFQKGHETLLVDIVDLVNRSQTQIQSSVGEPAQASILEELAKDVTRQLHDLDRRMDSMHIVSQTLNQIMQTHLQAVHTLQEQQGTMLTALMPLLPLLQAVPLHIDAAKNQIIDALSKCPSGSGSRLCLDDDYDKVKGDAIHRKRSRSPEDSEETLVASSTPKRPRTGSQRLMEPIDLRPAHDILSQRSINHEPLSPPFEQRFTTPSGPHRSNYAELGPSTDETRSLSPFKPSSDLYPALKTPQQPLTDLPAHTSAPRNKTTSPFEIGLLRSASRMSTIATPGPGRPPQLTRTLSTVSTRSNKATTLSRVDSAILNSLEKKRTSPSSTRPGSATIPDGLVAHPPPPPVSVIPTPAQKRLPRTNTITTIGPMMTPRELGRMPTLGGTMSRGSATPISATARFMRQNREGRPVSREGRRFIPLIDSDDEDEDRSAG